MPTKLTLWLDDKLIRQAKVARSKGVILSRMVKDYFRSPQVSKGKKRLTSTRLCAPDKARNFSHFQQIIYWQENPDIETYIQK